MPHDIFISYSSEDKQVADAICAGLEAQGVRCWIAPRDVGPGQDWAATIVDAIEHCRIFVIVLSSSSNSSSQVLREVERAVNAGKIVIPFRIEDLAPSKSLGYFLSVSHWMDAMTEPLEDHIDTLAATARKLLNDEEQGPDTPPATHGPRSFFGRGHRMPGNQTTLLTVIVVLLTAIILGLGWFFYYEQTHQTPVSQPQMMGSGMMGTGMKRKMDNDDCDFWR